jgi:hypothetical protein
MNAATQSAPCSAIASEKKEASRKRKIMANVLQSKLTKKLILLVVLAGAFAYLKDPSLIYGATCTQTCLAEERACVAGCGGSSNCSNECIFEYKSCVDSCPR